MTITSQQHHDDHEMRIHINKPGRQSYAALRCVTCNKHIQWLNTRDGQLLESLGVEVLNRFETKE
jgi:hypothetical protein